MAYYELQSEELVPFGHQLFALKLILRIAGYKTAILILKSSLKTARLRQAVFRLQR